MADRYRPVPDGHEIIRHVKPKELITDRDTGEVIGISLEAFRRKETEEGLSVTSCDEFALGTPEDNLAAAVNAVRGTFRGVKPGSAFAIAVTSDVTGACKARGYGTRVLFMPSQGNFAHAEARMYPSDDDELFDALARGCWSKAVLNSSIR